MFHKCTISHESKGRQWGHTAWWLLLTGQQMWKIQQEGGQNLWVQWLESDTRQARVCLYRGASAFCTSHAPCGLLPLSARQRPHHHPPYIYTVNSPPHSRYWISNIGHITAANGSTISTSPCTQTILKSMQIRNESHNVQAVPLTLFMSKSPGESHAWWVWSS